MIKLKSLLIENITDTPEFKRWFGNSKVVDRNGNPQIVYHGTTSYFNMFDNEKTGGRGYYFFKQKDAADLYAKGDRANTMLVYLSIKNPIKELDFNKIGIENGFSKHEAINFIKNKGYDGIIGQRYIVAFYPEQIKSAIGNNGDFNSNNPDITKENR